MMSDEKTPKNMKALSVAGQDVKRTDQWRVNPQLLVEEPGFNLRDYEAQDVKDHIRAFADSYKSGQYVPPMVVRVTDDGQVAMIEGHCRRRGLLLAISEGADIPYVDVVVFKGSDSERVEVMLRSAEGLKLKTIEVAEGYLRLIRSGYSIQEVAKKVSKSSSHVDNLLVLATANADVKKLVRDDFVAASVAIEVVRHHGEKAGQFLQEKIKAELEKAGVVEGVEAKTRLTSKTIREWTPPKNLMVNAVSKIETLVRGIDQTVLDFIRNQEKDDLSGKRVQIDALVLAEMVSLFEEVNQKRVADEARAAKKLEKSKGGLEGEEGAVDGDLEQKAA